MDPVAVFPVIAFPESNTDMPSFPPLGSRRVPVVSTNPPSGPRRAQCSSSVLRRDRDSHRIPAMTATPVESTSLPLITQAPWVLTNPFGSTGASTWSGTDGSTLSGSIGSLIRSGVQSFEANTKNDGSTFSGSARSFNGSYVESFGINTSVGAFGANTQIDGSTVSGSERSSNGSSVEAFGVNTCVGALGANTRTSGSTSGGSMESSNGFSVRTVESNTRVDAFGINTTDSNVGERPREGHWSGSSTGRLSSSPWIGSLGVSHWSQGTSPVRRETWETFCSRPCLRKCWKTFGTHWSQGTSPIRRET